MTKPLEMIEKELQKKKDYYIKKIDELFKPYEQMTEEEIQRVIDNPHYSSQKAEEYYGKIAEIQAAEKELFWMNYRRDHK